MANNMHVIDGWTADKQGEDSTMTSENIDQTGRQDLASPEPTLEKSDPTPVDVKRGQHLMYGIALVAVVFVILAVVIVMNN